MTKIVKSSYTPYVSHETYEERREREEFEAHEAQLFHDEAAAIMEELEEE